MADRRPVVYTVGTCKYYDPDLKTGRLIKLGRTARYPGGSVWRTPEEAAQHCNPEQAVYEVLADWDTQTAPNLYGEGWHDLLTNAAIVRRMSGGQRRR